MGTAEYRGTEKEGEDTSIARVLPPPWPCFVPAEPLASVPRRAAAASGFVSVARVGRAACHDWIDSAQLNAFHMWVRTCV